MLALDRSRSARQQKLYDSTIPTLLQRKCRSLNETIDVIVEYDEGPIDASDVHRDLENPGSGQDGAGNPITNHHQDCFNLSLTGM